MINNEPATFDSKEELYRLLDEGIQAMQSHTGYPAENVFSEIEQMFQFDIFPQPE